MGSKRRGRKNRRQQQNFDQGEYTNDSWQYGKDQITTKGQSHLGTYRITQRQPFLNSHSPTQRYQPTHNHAQNQNQVHSLSTRFQLQPRNNLATQTKSHHLKASLLSSMHHILQQLELWHPDPDEADDFLTVGFPTVDGIEMEWQPEAELVIPQPAGEVHYVWDPAPVVTEVAREVVQIGIGSLSSGLGESAFDGGKTGESRELGFGCEGESESESESERAPVMGRRPSFSEACHRNWDGGEGEGYDFGMGMGLKWQRVGLSMPLELI